MLQYLMQSFASIKTIKYTIAQAATQSKALNEIAFNPSNIIESGGIVISVVGYVVVFAALVLLYYFFGNLTKLINYNVKRKLKAKGGETEEVDTTDFSVPGEVAAAISMALNLHFDELHDIESTILTIKKVQRPYSPWSSKIYGLREYPRK